MGEIVRILPDDVGTVRPMTIEIGPLRTGDEEARYRLIRQAFGGPVDPDPDAPRAPDDQVLGAYRGDTLVGSTLIFHFGFHLAGTELPCGGVSGVVVAPEARGENVARRLNTVALERMHEAGRPIAALYPTTAPLYRSVGYEIAGWWRKRTIAVSDLPGPDRSFRWERVAVDDPRLWRVADRAGTRPDGDLRLDPIYEAWQTFMRTRQKTDNRHCYLGRREGEPEVALVYRSVDDGAPDSFYGIEIEQLHASSVGAVAAALGFVGTNGTVAGQVTFVLPEQVLALAAPSAHRSRIVQDFPLMTRLVDVGTAMELRPVPAWIDGAIDLHIVDPVLPHNDGPGRLTFSAGAAHWEPGAGDEAVTVTVQDLAAIYCGFSSRLARDAGRLDGATDVDCAILDTAFAARVDMSRFF